MIDEPTPDDDELTEIRPLSADPAKPSFDCLLTVLEANTSPGDAESITVDRPLRPEGALPWVRPPAMAETPPEIVGYEIIAEIGRGGMGLVYSAKQVGLNRVVALKMVLGQVRPVDAARHEHLQVR